MAGKEIFLGDNDYIVSKTDLKGKILYGNEIFVKMSGYTAEELIGKPHSIVRHPEMPKIVFQMLWDRLKAKQEIFAFVKNQAKNGDYYWVFTNVTPTIRNGAVVDYHSVRRKPNPEAIKVISSLYDELLKKEKTGGMDASRKLLEKTLEEKGMSYDEIIRTIQR